MSGAPEIAILAKAPIAGLAKTRLIPALGAAGAARLQATLTERTVQTALAAGLGPVTLWCMPDCTDPAFEDLAARSGVDMRPQVGAEHTAPGRTVPPEFHLDTGGRAKYFSSST